MEVSHIKQALRRQMAAVKKNIPAPERDRASEKILERVENLPEFRQCKTVLIYHALPDEVQTKEFIRKWHPCKRIVLPVVEGENLVLKEYIPGKVCCGAFSIQEPVGTRIVSPREIELAVIPGVAFDAACNRLGRGKGFYDRLIPHLSCKLIGLGYECQVVESIPAEAFDRPLDMVVTEKKIYF